MDIPFEKGVCGVTPGLDEPCRLCAALQASLLHLQLDGNMAVEMPSSAVQRC